ncbi:hypothetical protein HQ524_00575 [Candidatus Uhrbacteria bacterium]|nr:hypothetical protein [Candidatus Uhrbacteria bacterium]
MPAIQSTTPPTPGPANSPKPAANKVAPKTVIAPPPMQSMGQIHKHTGFIIAIAVTTLLLIASAVLAYITWSNGESLKNDIIGLNSNAQQIAQERDMVSTDLKKALEDLANAPKPAPFFYTTAELTEDGDLTTTLHSLTTEGKADIFTTTGPFSTSYSVYATPRVGFDGRIWLDENSDTNSPGIALREFDTIAGTTLMPTLFSDFLPVPDAIALSPDETRIAAAYSNENTARPDLAGQLVAWDLLTGDMTSLGTLEPSEHFGDTYFSEIWDSQISTFNVQWESNDCAVSSVYADVAVEATETEAAKTVRQYGGNRYFCME